MIAYFFITIGQAGSRHYMHLLPAGFLKHVEISFFRLTARKRAYPVLTKVLLLCVSTSLRSMFGAKAFFRGASAGRSVVSLTNQ